MPGWDNWGHQWGYGWAGALFMIVMMILFWGGLITVAVLVIRRFGHRDTGLNGAQRTLDERFARGEIDKDEYEQRSKALRAGQ